MPDGLNPEERRGYLAGVVAARLDGHDEHFREINGQIGELADSSRDANTKLDEVLSEMPRVLTIAQEADKAKIVADTLAKKTDAERSFIDRWKTHITFGLMTLIALLTLGSWASRILGTPEPAVPPPQTVTVPDITPGVYP